MLKNSYVSFGRIRIIGGQWKRRKLPVLNINELRPTMDIIRETLFNWLNPFIFNARCLDCFAGSGVLGLEALSRHAASVTLLEIEQRIVQQLKKNIIMLKTSNAKIININALTYLSKLGTPYNIVFVDPPFHTGILEATLILLERNNWLTNNSLIYIESEIKNNLYQIPNHWNIFHENTYGQVMYRLCHRKI